MSPLVVRDHVIVGVSGDFDNLPGFLRVHRSRDRQDAMAVGRHAARWALRHEATGGMTWMTGTYDPDLNLIYWGTGNPTPVLNGKTRPGDNLYTCSIVALNPDTGKLAWAFQPSPHDTHDWDAVETPVLVDADFRRRAAQDADADVAQRLLLRPRPDQRKESADHCRMVR